MGKVFITAATLADEPMIKQVYKECRSELGSFNLYQCWEKYLKKESNEHFHVIRGRGFVRWCYSNKYQSYLVKDIGVLKEFRGSGIGIRLLKCVPTPVMLKCNVDNEDGNAFYAKIGMKKAGNTTTKSGNPQNIWSCVEW